MKNTVEVPIVWLEELMKLSKKTDVHTYSTGTLNGFRTDKTGLAHLKGYIESAKQFTENLDEANPQEVEK